MDRPALAEFLVRHREALLPEDVGLYPGARRRVPGLRREEVAQLAVMSTDYYTRLEQRRGPQPSTQMLDALARALRLSLDEREDLHRLAGHSAPERGALVDHVAPPLLRVMDRLADTPAFILDALGRTLVANDPARALYGDERDRLGNERSEVFRWFAHPEPERRRYPPGEHEHHSRALVASLRAAYGTEAGRADASALAEEITARSEEFAQLWDAQLVSRRFTDHKVVLHPEIGAIEVDCQALLTEDQSQALLVLTAAPGSEDADKLRLLSVLGTQQFAADGT
jgi:transcriptional regulator with XRE-family HTH domain